MSVHHTSWPISKWQSHEAHTFRKHTLGYTDFGIIIIPIFGHHKPEHSSVYYQVLKRHLIDAMRFFRNKLTINSHTLIVNLFGSERISYLNIK